MLQLNAVFERRPNLKWIACIVICGIVAILWLCVRIASNSSDYTAAYPAVVEPEAVFASRELFDYIDAALSNDITGQNSAVAKRFQEIVDAPYDEWSVNMQSALLAFLGSRIKFYELLSGRTEGRVFCSQVGCVIQFAAEGVAQEDGPRHVDDMRARLAEQLWMRQLKQISDTSFSVLTESSSYYYLQTLKKVD